MRELHKQAMMNHQIYEDIIARRNGMDYSVGICFQISPVNTEEAKVLTKNNQMGKMNQKQGRKFRGGSTKHLRITSNDFLVGIYYQKAKKSALAMGISLSDTKKAT